MSDELTGHQVAEILKYLADKVQYNLDNGADIVDELKELASKVEKDHNG